MHMKALEFQRTRDINKLNNKNIFSVVVERCAHKQKLFTNTILMLQNEQQNIYAQQTLYTVTHRRVNVCVCVCRHCRPV